MNTSELIKNAVKNKRVEVKFDLEIEGQKVPFMLTEIDEFEMTLISDLAGQQLRIMAEERGLVGKPLDEIEWSEWLESLAAKNKAIYIARGKPKDKADFFVMRRLGYKIIFEVISKCLRDADGKKPFATKDDESAFRELVALDQGIQTSVANAYIELNAKLDEVRAAAKNSLRLANGTNGKSANTPPDDGKVIEARSVESSEAI